MYPTYPEDWWEPRQSMHLHPCTKLKRDGFVPCVLLRDASGSGRGSVCGQGTPTGYLTALALAWCAVWRVERAV